MKETNALITKECAENKQLTYVDVATSMLDPKGEVRMDICKNDNLHINKEDYTIWRDILNPILIEKELVFEPKIDTKSTE